MIVKLGLGEVDWSWTRGWTNKVELSLGEVSLEGTKGWGDEGELSVLVSLPLGGTFNLHLSFPSASSASHEVQGIGGVDEVLLLPGEKLLGVVNSLGGSRADTWCNVSELCVLVSLPLGGPNYSNLS